MRFGMLLKFAAPLLSFSSNALDTANNASHENTSDQERCVRWSVLAVFTQAARRFKCTIALSIATLMINFHISYTFEWNRLIENYFMSLTDYMEAMALIKFQLNLFF